MIMPYLGSGAILDSVKDAVFAISLDKLKSGATSPCTLSFSNAAPNLVASFANNTLNKAQVEKYIKSVNGGTLVGMSVYVQQATDQSGNGNHAIQNTASNQPRVMNNGVWDVDAMGKVIMYFIAASTCKMATNTLSATISSICSMSFVGRTTGGSRVFGFGDDTFDTNLILGAADNATFFAIGCRVPENQLILSGSLRSKGISFYNRKTTTLQESFLNGATNGTNVNLTTTLNGTKIGLGVLATSAPIYSDSFISEAIIFSKPLSINERKKLEKNQSKRYQIALS